MRAFRSPGEFASFLIGLAGSLPLAEARGIRGAGEVVQAEAVNSLGHYQEAAGPFPAWAPLSDRTHEQRAEAGLPIDEPLRATWELRNHIELTAESRSASVGVPSVIVGDGSKANPYRDIGMVATIMELGNERVPARPFLGRAAFVRGQAAVKAAGAIVGAHMAGQPFDRRPATSIADDIPF